MATELMLIDCSTLLLCSGFIFRTNLCLLQCTAHLFASHLLSPSHKQDFRLFPLRVVFVRYREKDKERIGVARPSSACSYYSNPAAADTEWSGPTAFTLAGNSRSCSSCARTSCLCASKSNLNSPVSEPTAATSGPLVMAAPAEGLSELPVLAVAPAMHVRVVVTQDAAASNHTGAAAEDPSTDEVPPAVWFPCAHFSLFRKSSLIFKYLHAIHLFMQYTSS